MAMTIRNLPLVGFHGLESNRGPVRYRNRIPTDISDEEVQRQRQATWDTLRKRVGDNLNARMYLYSKKIIQLPESVCDVNEALLINICGGIQLFKDDGTPMHLEFLCKFFTDDGTTARQTTCPKADERDNKVRALFDTSYTLRSLIPIMNIITGIVKIVFGIVSDGSFFNVLEKDRGWKFKATLIAVGIAEVCFLGFLVHGIASLYFAAKKLETQPA